MYQFHHRQDISLKNEKKASITLNTTTQRTFMDLGKAQLKPLAFLLQFLKVGVLVRQSEVSFLS